MITQQEALELLSDGHTIWTVEGAKEICAAVGVEFREHLIKKFKSDPPGTFKGLTMNPEVENADGVDSLVLSQYVAKCLGVESRAGDYFGRGSQARAYARAIEQALKEKKEEK